MFANISNDSSTQRSVEPHYRINMHRCGFFGCILLGLAFIGTKFNATILCFSWYSELINEEYLDITRFTSVEVKKSK